MTDELIAARSKFEKEADILIRMLERLPENDPDPIAITLALQQAKRGRTASTVLVRALAAYRDQLQP